MNGVVDTVHRATHTRLCRQTKPLSMRKHLLRCHWGLVVTTATNRHLKRAFVRPIQIWVPDVRSRSFASKAHQQSSAVAKSHHAREDQEFIDAISDRDAT